MIKAVLGQRVSPAVNRASEKSTAFPLQPRAVDKVPGSVVGFFFEEISLLHNHEA